MTYGQEKEQPVYIRFFITIILFTAMFVDKHSRLSSGESRAVAVAVWMRSVTSAMLQQAVQRGIGTFRCRRDSSDTRLQLSYIPQTLNVQMYTMDHDFIMITIIYPLTARVNGAPQMISQPVSSVFPCSPLPSGTWRTPGLSIP